MNGGRKCTEAEKERFLPCISGQCTGEDRDPSEVIAAQYGGNADAYMADMLSFDPTYERFLIVSYRDARHQAPARMSQRPAE